MCGSVPACPYRHARSAAEQRGHPPRSFRPAGGRTGTTVVDDPDLEPRHTRNKPGSPSRLRSRSDGDPGGARQPHLDRLTATSRPMGAGHSPLSRQIYHGTMLAGLRQTGSEDSPLIPMRRCSDRRQSARPWLFPMLIDCCQSVRLWLFPVLIDCCGLVIALPGSPAMRTPHSALPAAVRTPHRNGLAGAAGAAPGTLHPDADRPFSRQAGQIPRRHRAASRALRATALRVPAGPPAAALDPTPGGAGRRPRRPPGRPEPSRPAASTSTQRRFRRNRRWGP